MRLLNKYGRIFQCEHCKATWSPTPYWTDLFRAGFGVVQIDETGKGAIYDPIMNTYPVSRLENDAVYRNGSPHQTCGKPFVVPLENIPATPAHRKRIRAHVRELNRELEESSIPFRLRLL